MLTRTLIAASVLAASVSAQTHTDCNPLKTTCPANPAIAKGGIDCDFTKGACSSFVNQAGTDLTYDSDGARFDLSNAKQAPTISSEFFFFGEVEVVVKAAPGGGIVTALVLQSQDLDEIDWEWVGYDNKQVQSNYFYKGDTTTYDRGGFSAVSTPFDTFHTYGFKWTAEKLEWTIDGATVRTLTYASNPDHYPQTPMQVKLGTWVAGYEGNNQGTIDWAGGIANFDNAPIKAWFKSVKVVDYAGGNSPTTDCIKEYSYGDNTGSYKSIKVVKDDTCSSSSTSSSATSSATSSGSATGSATTETGSKTTGSATDSNTKTGSATDSKTTGTSTDTRGTTPSGTLGTTPSGTLGTTPSGTLGVTPSGTSKNTSKTTPIGSGTGSITGTPTGSSGSSPTNSNGDELTTSTVYNYITHTVTKCPETVTNCPLKSTVIETKTVAIGVTVCPIKDLPKETQAPVVTSWESTSTIYKTTIKTVTHCGPEVTNCPYDKASKVVVTETAPASTVVHAITSTNVSPGSPSQAPIGNQCGPGFPNCPAPLSSTPGPYVEYHPGATSGITATAPNYNQPSSAYTPPSASTKAPVVGGGNSTAPTSVSVPPAPQPTSGASRAVGVSLFAGLAAVVALF